MESRGLDWVRRGIRSFLQGFIGVLLITAVPALNDLVTSVGSGGVATIDVPFWRNVGIAAVAGGAISLIACVQNFLEDKTPMPALLKSKPNAGQNPVPATQ